MNEYNAICIVLSFDDKTNVAESKYHTEQSTSLLSQICFEIYFFI